MNKKDFTQYLLDNKFTVEKDVNTNNPWGFGGAIMDVFTKGGIVVKLGRASFRHAPSVNFITITVCDKRIYDEELNPRRLDNAKEEIDKLISI